MNREIGGGEFLPRKIGECPTRPEEVDPHPGSETRIYEMQMITPIFGGGAEAEVNDPVTLIRPSSIRGHLRFWWRATRGAKCKTVNELRKKEGEIWGTPENPSSVCIEVVVEEQDDPFECASYKHRGDGGYRLEWSAPFNVQRSSLPYVLFPFQGKAPESDEPKNPSKMVKSARFKLITHISSANGDNIEKDVEAAVWAWVNFGGIGARTRRGCGALYCLNPKSLTPPSFEEFKKWLIERSEHYELPTMHSPPSSEEDAILAKSSFSVATHSSSSLRTWPTLGRILLKDGRDSISSWDECIKVMNDLRQRSEGRDRGSTMRPGRSRWPEPESLRKLIVTQKHLVSRPRKMHPPDHRMKNIIAFPRVEFGMPTIIEIRKEGIKPTLQPDKDHDRMASPLILKPVRFSNGRFASMIIRLNSPPLDTAYVKPGKNDLEFGHPISLSEIRDTRLASYPDSPIDKFCSTGSALDAFISFALSRGFVEVGL